ncbi:hypothetical protein EPYR_01935 [Erwinia pyrifoliae DSM 12163]|nr:hypothetical protein EPYR_01935 [Erwinia pyrifoliae DSM 12163]
MLQNVLLISPFPIEADRALAISGWLTIPDSRLTGVQRAGSLPPLMVYATP